MECLGINADLLKPDTVTYDSINNNDVTTIIIRSNALMQYFPLFETMISYSKLLLLLNLKFGLAK